MRKKITLVLLLGVVSYNVFSCDGCISSDGFLITQNKNAIMLKYGFSGQSGWHTHLTQNQHTHTTGEQHVHTDRSKTSSVEYFHKLDLAANIVLVPRLALEMHLPYVYNMEKEDGKLDHSIHGFSDAWFLAKYRLLNKKSCSATPWSINASINAGGRFPTGKWRFNELNVDPSFTPGKGNFSSLLGFMASAQYKSFGFISSLLYQINFKNALNYRYGNTNSLRFSVFKQWKNDKVNFRFMLDGTLDELGKDTYLGEMQTNTGGKLMFSGLTLQMTRPKYNVYGQVKIPTYNYLYGNQGNALTRVDFGFQFNI